jgi:hypothetical protein
MTQMSSLMGEIFAYLVHDEVHMLMALRPLSTNHKFHGMEPITQCITKTEFSNLFIHI